MHLEKLLQKIVALLLFLVVLNLKCSVIFAEVSSTNSLSVNMDLESLTRKIENGKTQLQMLLDDAGTPCWKTSILLLINKECHSLSYNSRSKISFQLTNCHLFQSGLNSIPCDDLSGDISNCVQEMAKDARAFSIYNNFFTHIDNICLYSQIQNNHNIMNDAILNMYSATLDSSQLLKKVNENTNHFNKIIIENQNVIIENNDEVKKFHENHLQNIKQLQNLAGNLKDQQNEILNNQNDFLSKQENLLYDVNNMQLKQEVLINNQNELSAKFVHMNEQQNQLHHSIEKAIDMQQNSIEFHKKMQEAQENSFQQLHKNQNDIASYFQKSFEHHNELLLKQQETKYNIDNLQNKTSLLREETIESQNKLKMMYDWQQETLTQTQQKIQHIADFSENAYQQLMFLINKVFVILEKIYQLDLQILMEFFSIQSFLFYFVWIFVIFLFTTPISCRASRAWLLVSVLLTIVIERYAINQIFSSNTTFLTFSKFVRQIMILLNIWIYVYFARQYRDIHKENMTMLMQIHNQMRYPRANRRSIHWISSPKSKLSDNSLEFYFKKPSEHFYDD